MGNQANDILQNLNLLGEEANQYETVKECFHSFFFIRKKNIIYEQAVFNRWQQGPN